MEFYYIYQMVSYLIDEILRSYFLNVFSEK